MSECRVSKRFELKLHTTPSRKLNRECKADEDQSKQTRKRTQKKTLQGRQTPRQQLELVDTKNIYTQIRQTTIVPH